MKRIMLGLLLCLTLTCYAIREPKLRMSFYMVEDDSTLIIPERVYKEYSNDLSEYDIELSIPEGFKPISFITAGSKLGMRFFEHSDCFPNVPNTFYPLGLESGEQDAMFLYPALYFDFGNQTLRLGNEIETELRAVHKDCELDVNPYVDIFDVRKLKGFANADTVAIYDFRPDSFLSPGIDTARFKHCVGVYLRSKNHPALLLKILLTDEGYINKDEYIGLLLDNVKYGELGGLLSSIENQLTNHYTDLCFPSVLPRYRESSKFDSAKEPVMDELPEKYKDRSSEDPQK